MRVWWWNNRRSRAENFLPLQQMSDAKLRSFPVETQYIASLPKCIRLHFWKMTWAEYILPLLPLLLLLPLHLSAQDSLHHQLQEVQVNAQAERVGHQQQTLAAAALATEQLASAAEVLSRHSSLLVLQYGADGTALPALRGTGRSHTRVLWNGLELNSPTLGQVNLANLPLLGGTGLQLHYGGSSLLLTEGGFGGAVSLATADTLQHQLLLQSGSFGQMGAAAQTGVQHRQSQHQLQLYGIGARNNFNFTNAFGEQKRQQQAGYRQYGSTYSGRTQLSKQQQLQWHLWWQQRQQQVQPATHVQLSDEEILQTDTRAVVQWQQQHRGGKTEVLLGGSSGSFRWNNHLAELAQQLQTQQLQLQATHVRALGQRWLLESGLRTLQEAANSIQFGGRVQQSRYAAHAAAEFFASSKWSFSAQTKVLQLPQRPLAMLGAVAAEYSFNRQWQWQLQLSRNVRPITLNERYWQVQAEQLRPENGYSLEQTVQHQRGLFGGNFSSSSSLFFHAIQDWVLWRPGVPSWRPINLQKVHAAGLQQELQFDSQHLSTRLSYSYTHTGEVAAGEWLAKNQLLFVPRHNFNGFAQWQRGAWQLFGNVQSFSTRFTTTDGQRQLPGYQLLGLGIGYRLSINQQPLQLQLRADNVLNTRYQTIPFFAMPGRSFELQLRWHFTAKRAKP